MSSVPAHSPHRRRDQVTVSVAIALVVVAVVAMMLFLPGVLSFAVSHIPSGGGSSGASSPGNRTSGSPPNLPPLSSMKGEPGGWSGDTALTSWSENGHPVLYFYGATWCPYCAASSWVVFKVFASLGGASNVPTGYSNEGSIPEVVVQNLPVPAGPVALIADEDTSGVIGTLPTASTPTAQAYVNAYAGGGIPFVVVNGQYIHPDTLVEPTDLQEYANGANGGAGAVEQSMLAENGTAWSAVDSQVFLVLAFVTFSLGTSVQSLATEYHWSGVLIAGVLSAMNSV